MASSTHAKFQVFLSFRGTDTRNSFTSHLYSSLQRKQIKTFIDYELERGSEISPTLLKLIEEAAISVVIFSENYAYSAWCLDELVKIIECKNMKNQMVLPVFYGVDPNNVGEQKGSYGDAFCRHEVSFSIARQKSWRNALSEAANLSGWDSLVIRPESKLIDEIVEDICKKLNSMSTSSQDSAEMYSGTPRIESSFWQANAGIPRIQSSFWN
ncbi:disease resistance protein RPV1-like [Mercurialis annua]|uniref:disease resistance protein RPV1-like n=1 Tax=Mercurialis annua TaxID=3986 RepID=UPI00215F7DC7|nr:disease resistance protein RPV1-like [Mercurialis annua]